MSCLYCLGLVKIVEVVIKLLGVWGEKRGKERKGEGKDEGFDAKKASQIAVKHMSTLSWWTTKSGNSIHVRPCRSLVGTEDGELTGPRKWSMCKHCEVNIEKSLHLAMESQY